MHTHLNTFAVISCLLLMIYIYVVVVIVIDFTVVVIVVDLALNDLHDHGRFGGSWLNKGNIGLCWLIFGY